MIRRVDEHDVNSRNHYIRVSIAGMLSVHLVSIFVLMPLRQCHTRGSDEPTANDSEGVSNILSGTERLFPARIFLMGSGAIPASRWYTLVGFSKPAINRYVQGYSRYTGCVAPLMKCACLCLDWWIWHLVPGEILFWEGSS